MGHAFWFLHRRDVQKENVTYLLYLATVYKNLNKAFAGMQEEVQGGAGRLRMEYQGYQSTTGISPNANPTPRVITSKVSTSAPSIISRWHEPNNEKQLVRCCPIQKGIVRVIFNDDFTNKTLLKFGVRG